MPRRFPQIRVPLSLRRQFPSASFVGCADIRVTEATECSGDCGPNTLFAALPGSQVDGTQFVAEAVERGANALLVERPLAGISVPQCVVPNVRKAYAQLCHALVGSPTRRLGVVGVTGTNGKTTVTWLVRSILAAAGKQAGVLGTIEYNDGRNVSQSTLTTPDSKTLSNWLSAMVWQGTSYVAMEVSSHALDQDRISGVMLDVGVVTNITQDHFDYHQDYDSYRCSKAQIGSHIKKNGTLVLNADDPGSSSIRESLDGESTVVTFGLECDADVSGQILDESLAGSQFELRLPECRLEVNTALVGRHNVSNCLAAAAVAMQLDISPEAIQAGIESLTTVPGRLERVECGQPFDVFVDYAHTDDALSRCLSSLKQLSQKRVICVFGAGGDRDRTKRPLLGRAAATADVAIVTNDNPRTENPEQIIQDVVAGFEGTQTEPHIEFDRAEAIREAITRAEPGDCVLIAGKGHEDEQLIGTERIRFDDREVAARLLIAATGLEHNELRKIGA